MLDAGFLMHHALEARSLQTRKAGDDMRLVKMFKTIESELWSMENEINKWVEDTGATIVQVTGNIAPDDLVVAP